MVDFRTKDPFYDLIPKEGWLSKYMLYASGGEIPPRFNFFAGLFVLSSAIRRSVYFEKDQKLFPNFYIILISPPAIGKKSSAIALADRIIQGMKKNKPRCLSSKITGEGLLQNLDTGQDIVVGDKVTITSTGILMCSELINLLGKQQYLTGLIGYLTELYDCPEFKSIGSVKHGEWKLRNVFLNLFGGITPKGLQNDVPSETLDTGFLSRVLLIPLPENWDIRVPRPLRRDPILQEILTKGLETYATLGGEMSFSVEAEKAYDNWYLTRPSKIDQGYAEREPDHILKMCMLWELSKTKTLIISMETLDEVFTISNWLRATTRTLLPQLRAEQSSVRANRVYEKLLVLVKELKTKRVPHSKLLMRCWYFLPGRGGEFGEIMQLLKELRRVEEYRDPESPSAAFYTPLETSLWESEGGEE